MFSEEVMTKITERSKNDPEFAKVFDNLFKWSQEAQAVGMDMKEIAAICTLGFAIASDPSLKSMVSNMIKISNIGLDITGK
jgi:hypothetical protein|tara:strand:+ start:431 stop:673 length:243 start_codon:yes stop_codon:yes gene_type:complete